LFENIWRGGAVLWVDVGSKRPNLAVLYWIRGKEDRGKRGRGRKKDVIVIRDRGGDAVFVVGKLP